MATTWETLIKRGYRVHYSATIEGIPYLFTEQTVRRVDAATEAAVPADYASAVDALWIADGTTIGIEVDREKGVARGDAWDLTLGWQALEDAGLLDDLFRRPTAVTILTADLDSAATTITVDDTAGMTGLTYLYLGRECVTFSGTGGSPPAATFTGASRGVAAWHAGNEGYDYLANSPGTYGQVASHPQVWRGRWVELHGHLVSPEGRMVASTYCTGDYHRVVWRGYIDAVPRPGKAGMVLRCLPLVRLLGSEVGFSIEAEVMAPEGDGAAGVHEWPVYVTPGATVGLSMTYNSGGGDSFTTVEAPAFTAVDQMPLGQWVYQLTADLLTAISGEPWYVGATVQIGYPPGVAAVVYVNVFFDAATYAVTEAQMTSAGGAYWMGQGQFPGVQLGSALLFTLPVTLLGAGAVGGWLPVKQSSGEAWQDTAIPSAGLGILEGDESKEVVRWDSIDSTLTPIILLHIAQRQVGGTPLVAIAPGVKFKVATGTLATPGVATLTLIESSGTGERGTYDTLALGFGYGVPSEFLNEASFTQIGLGTNCHAISAGRSSLESIMGGWAAILGRCVIQRPDPTSKDAVVMVTATAPVVYALATNLSSADVLLESIDTPEMVDGPNEVEITRDGLSDEADVVVRLVPRIQAEGPRSWSLRVPTINVPMAVALGANLTRLGDGQSIIRLAVAPWVALYVGDPVKLTIAHPLQYDWSAGSRAPATVFGRVVGWQVDLGSGKQMLSILLAGHADETQYLCPSAVLASKDSSTQITLTSGGGFFSAADVVTIYSPGEESTREATYTINTVVGQVVTFTGALASWVSATDILTYPPLASATTDQDDWVFDAAAYSWEG